MDRGQVAARQVRGNQLRQAVKDAGLLLGISVGGVTQAATGTLEGDDAMDLGVAGEIADFVDLRCYDYGGMPPSIAPHWWIEACIRYALEKKNVPPQNMTAGLATFSAHWPDAAAVPSDQMTYAQAIAFVKEAGAQIEWVESDDNGSVLESRAQVGQGAVWLTDEKTYRAGLDLVQRYGLLGNTMFAAGLGSEAQWEEMANWQKSR